MKKYLVILFLFFALTNLSLAQVTLTLQPDGATGKDCEVWSLQPSTNYVSNLLRGNAWTWGYFGIERGFIQFDLSSIPQNAIVNSAYLSLFAPDSPSTEFDYPATGSNQCWLQRVTSDWSETTLTWDNQPATTAQNQFFLPQSITYYDDYVDLNVAALVQDMVSDPINSYGFMVRLDTEINYRRLSFCSSDYPNIAKHPKLVITYNSNESITVCQKFCIDFEDPSVNNPTSWLWTFEGASPTTSTEKNPLQICYNTPGVYDMTLVTTNAYGADTLFMNDYVKVIATPPVPTIVQNQDTLISSLASSYQWQFNSSDIAGATNQFYVANQSGFYTVVIGDESGCQSSASVYYLATAISNAIESSIYLFPNPCNDRFYLKSSSGVIDDGIAIKVIDIYGKIILDSKDVNFNDAINIHEFPSQTYFVVVETKNIVQQFRIIKE